MCYMLYDNRLFPVALGSGVVGRRQQPFTLKKLLFDAPLAMLLQTGDYILLCKRGAGGFPAQGRRLCAVHPQEEGKPAREPSRPGKGGAGGEPGAHRQEGGEEHALTQHLHLTKLSFSAR